MMQKACGRCGVWKPHVDFRHDKRSSDGRASNCKQCHEAISRESRERYGDARHYRMVRRYRISALEVEEMIPAQGGLCASCGERPAEQVDHDHKTGRVRGILCDGCNGGIALFDEDIDLLMRAAAYLNGELDL